MSHDTIGICFWVSFAVGTSLGVAVLVWSGKRIVRTMSGTLSLATLFIKMLPAMAVFVLTMLPSLYFNYLGKQERHCIEIIRRNAERVGPDHEVFSNECKGFDVDGLFRQARL